MFHTIRTGRIQPQKQQKPFYFDFNHADDISEVEIGQYDYKIPVGLFPRLPADRRSETEC